MTNLHPSPFFDNRTPIWGIKIIASIIVVSFLLTIGCKSTDKSKSYFPFFGGGTQVDPATVPAEMPPTQPVVVREAPGPAMPTTTGIPAATSGVSGAYDPPSLMPGSGSPSSTTVSPPSNSSTGTTMVYDVAPGTNTNGGGTAGTMPRTYSTQPPDHSSLGTSRLPYSDYGGTSITSGTNSGTGRSSSPGNTSSSDKNLDNGSSYDYDNRIDNRSGYGNGSRNGDNDYHGPPTGQTTFRLPTGKVLNDGDYFADDGSKIRVINGKTYELVQYFDPGIPPTLPGWSGDVTNQLTTNSPNVTPQILTPQNINLVPNKRTAIQMTQATAGVPIPSYSEILNQQSGVNSDVAQGLVTVTFPTTVTVLPESTGVETVPSLEYSDYSQIGIQTAASASSPGNGNASADSEMQRSVWSMMAAQNNDFLLYDAKNQNKSINKDLPAYLPLNGMR